MAISEAAMLRRVEPFWSWHTPIAWTGYIFFVDGLIWKIRGESPIRNDRAEMVFVALASVPLWVVFELYNKYTLHNWHYVGLPDVLLLRYVGYAWAFATIWPAIFETAELVGCLRDRRAPEYRRVDPRRLPLDARAWIAIAAGAAMLIWPIVRPSPRRCGSGSFCCSIRSTPTTAPNRSAAIWPRSIRDGSSICCSPGWPAA
jgi:hypothetical protein